MKDSYFTHKEIVQQGNVWKKVFEIVTQNRLELSRILSEFKYDSGSEAIFTGAGSSFFVGEMVAGIFLRNTGISSKAISTTELVTHPEFYINPSRKTLLVSFARSGNSPESVAAVELADQISENITNLIITCNNEGALSTSVNVRNKHILTMPSEANDKGLAMTSSVTSMALAAILFSDIDQIESLQNQVVLASEYADSIIKNHSDEIHQAAKLDFNRAVFLGSGPFLGSAREGHLKLQELTDGKVICKFDSFLAFRHGPKVVVDENTLVFYMFSNDEYVEQYELDMANAIKTEHHPKFIIGVSEQPLNRELSDLSIVLSDNGEQLDEQFLSICSLIPAQLLGYYKSIEVGLNPDTPSVSGAIHRVVQGVVIYDFKNLSQLSNG